MIDAFAEGVRSLDQVCHLVVTAPVALTIVAGRGRWQTVLGAIVGVVLGGWIFVTNTVGSFSDLQLRASAVVVMIAVVILGFPSIFDRGQPAWLHTLGRRAQTPGGSAVIAAGVAVLVAQWWRPCVGVELGSILTTAPDEPFGQLAPTVGFMLGISIPLIVIGLVYAAWTPARAVSNKIGWVGAGLVALLALSVIAGQHGEIVSRLFQWSQ